MTQYEMHPEYTRYIVSDEGEVLNHSTNNKIRPRPNRQGDRGAVAMITIRHDNGLQKTISLAKFVAETWLGVHPDPNFNTPINLNGDRFDCRPSNLAWRPRWFAMEYHKQFFTDPNWGSQLVPVQNTQTGVVWPTLDEAVVGEGLLRMNLSLGCLNGALTHPYGVLYRFIKR